MIIPVVSIAGALADLSGDLTEDGIIDAGDLAIMAGQWLSPPGSEADIISNDGVNIRDFNLLAENWLAEAPAIIISEFLAVNDNGLLDEDGESSDWIELYNPGDSLVNLEDFSLTDKRDKPRKWIFPAVSIASDEYIIVFASGKDRSDPESQLHTNFSLSSSGEYLALIRPDGRTVSSVYNPFPNQFADISYGISQSAFEVVQETLIAATAAARAFIPYDGSVDGLWIDPEFDDAGWLTGSTGVGYDYSSLIGLDVGAMRYNIQSVYIRIEFEVADPDQLTNLLLRMKYEDGFAAFLNGFPVADVNAPDIESLSYLSASEANRPDSQAIVYEDIDVSDYLGFLQVGRNVLAVQGLNFGTDSSDLLIFPELIARRVSGSAQTQQLQGYIYSPTPGGANGGISANAGPAIREVTDVVVNPSGDSDIVISARIEETSLPITQVQLHWLVMYDSLNTTAMYDDGTHLDDLPGDGVYYGTIPSSAFNPGEMVRWSVTATDEESNQSRQPLFPYPTNSPQYYGTVIADPALISDLPVIHWYIETPSAANNRTGTRASLYYNEQFYDNVYVRIRGGSITGLSKKSYKFEFNDGDHFKYNPDCPRVDEINVNQTYTDKSYMRQTLSFESYNLAGAPGSNSFLVRLQQNGDFFSVAQFVEQVDKDLLEREGLGKNGALYKMYNGVTSGTSKVEKKNRREEDNTDLIDLVSNINNLTGAARTNYIFDHIDVPACLNYLAASVIIQHDDDSVKNYYLYCDSDGSGQWLFIPWDIDLTFGRHYMTQDSILSDIIWADTDYYIYDNNNGIFPSHPFVDTELTPGNRAWNHLTDALLNTPEFKEMYKRRLRSLMDKMLQSPITSPAEKIYENRISEMITQASDDIALDIAKWGQYGAGQSLLTATDILINDYLTPRREHLYNTHHIDNVGDYDISGSFSAGLPDGQPAVCNVTIDPVVEFSPATGNQDQEYIRIVNNESHAVDVSGWMITGGVEHTFKPGTVLLAGGDMYVSPDVRSFLNRPTSPRGSEGRLVQGNYDGHLSSWPETLNLIDADGGVRSSVTYIGNPSEAQRYLRITEIMYHPAQGGSFNEEEYEFIELKNIGSIELLLDGISFTDGIVYQFPPAEARILQPGEYLILPANQTAFAERYDTAGLNLATGEYVGLLSNGGEPVKLEDALNNTILSFEYDDDWYDVTDGGGYSLTVIDPNAAIDSWGVKASWRAGALTGGSPGACGG